MDPRGGAEESKFELAFAVALGIGRRPMVPLVGEFTGGETARG